MTKGDGLLDVPLDQMVGIAPSMIDLSKNSIRVLPDALFMPPLSKRLVMLALSHNKIEALPDSIGLLTLLK
jgi:Leucine-rich repeat (LRR) protein